MKIKRVVFRKHVLVPGVGEVKEVDASPERRMAIVGDWVRIGAYLFHGDSVAHAEMDETATVSRGRAAGAADGEAATDGSPAGS